VRRRFGIHFLRRRSIAGISRRRECAPGLLEERMQLADPPVLGRQLLA
jgi:hypothetical protein